MTDAASCGRWDGSTGRRAQIPKSPNADQSGRVAAHILLVSRQAQAALLSCATQTQTAEQTTRRGKMEPRDGDGGEAAPLTKKYPSLRDDETRPRFGGHGLCGSSSVENSKPGKSS